MNDHQRMRLKDILLRLEDIAMEFENLDLNDHAAKVEICINDIENMETK